MPNATIHYIVIEEFSIMFVKNKKIPPFWQFILCGYNQKSVKTHSQGCLYDPYGKAGCEAETSACVESGFDNCTCSYCEKGAYQILTKIQFHEISAISVAVLCD